MRKMKDSGVEWIGEIPEGWTVSKMKHLAFEPLQYGANSTGIEYDATLPRYIRITDINANNELIHDGKQSLPIHIAKDYLLNSGDILFARSGATAGKSFYYYGDEISCFAGYLIRLRVNPFKAISKFIYYYTLTLPYLHWTQQIFIQSTIQNISAEKYKTLVFAMPSDLKIQQKIVNYLDEKTSAIDVIVSEKQNLISLLKEQRQAIIMESVTKGLDPTVPMKDSGVEWIGEIPEDWESMKLGKIAEIATGNTPSKNEQSTYYSNEGLLWVKPDNLSGLIPIIQTNEYLTEKGRRLGRIAPPNTTLVCCIGTIGKYGYSENECAYNQQINALIFNNKKVDWKFGLYSISCQEQQHVYYANGNVVKILNTENQKKIIIAIPSMQTQQKIVDYLGEKTSAIDTLVADITTQIEKLKEYRQSLIYEAVTGKIEI